MMHKRPLWRLDLQNEARGFGDKVNHYTNNLVRLAAYSFYCPKLYIQICSACRTSGFDKLINL